MVFNKINITKIIIFLTISLILGIASFLQKGPTETNLLKTILPDNVSSELVSVSDKLSSVVKVVYESDSEENLEDLKTNFLSKVDETKYEIIKSDFSQLLKLYSKTPQNFLSLENREQIKEGHTGEIINHARMELYNPLWITFADYDKDPYFLVTNFIKELEIKPDRNTQYHKLYYDYGLIKLKDGANVKELVELQNKLSKKNDTIYLAGSPIHTYHTQKSAIISINIICTLVSFLILGLTKFYFKEIKVLLPAILSIGFGFLAGYTVTRLVFNTFHIITLVFSTTLIGIGIDYSYHYLFNEKHDNNFRKNLTNSMLTTVIAFGLLYFTNFELLKQISLLTSVGLISIWLFVLFIMPCFDLPKPETSININIKKRDKYIIWGIVGLVIIGGGLKLNFNNSISSFYNPPEKLKIAEDLCSKVSGTPQNTTIVLTKGNTTEEIAQYEEELGGLLPTQNSYLSGSRFIPSEKRQKENARLELKLYRDYKDNDGLLTNKQINYLKTRKYEPVNKQFTDIPFLKNFMIDDKTSVMYVYSNLPKINPDRYKIIDIKGECSKYLKTYSNYTIKILPVIFLAVLLFLITFYGIKKGTKMFLPPLISSVFAISLASLTGQSITLFSLISVILVLGFTIDYSIFRAGGGRKSEDAIFISCITTAFSFFALSFTSFKFISSLSFILFAGIATSYILGRLILSDDNEHI